MNRASRIAVITGIGVTAGILALVGASGANASGSDTRTSTMTQRAKGPAPLPPDPPDSVAGQPPGTYPVWPVDTTGPAAPTAADVARDFAVRALGLSDPTVTESATTAEDGIGTVTISLPAANRDLEVVAQRRLDGTWIIIRAGDQRLLGGITMLPDGKFDPILAIHPPAGATSGDLTEVAFDGTHEVRLASEELGAGVAHLRLSGNPPVQQSVPVHTVLIVYRDAAGRPLDALGGEFG